MRNGPIMMHAKTSSYLTYSCLRGNSSRYAHILDRKIHVVEVGISFFSFSPIATLGFYLTYRDDDEFTLRDILVFVISFLTTY